MQQLYAHQQEAVQAIATGRHIGVFFEMGLGKTAVSLRAMAARLDERHLVVAPAVVAHNWMREAARWAPELKAQLITTGADTVDPAAQLVVTTHALTIGKLHAELMRHRWGILCVDEAHALKNHKAKRTRAIYQLGFARDALQSVARQVVLLTGTPMPNNPSELWTMIRALWPDRIVASGKPMNWWQFRARYCRLAPSNYGDGFKVVGAQNQQELRERLKGCAIRKTKAQCLDLPPMRWATIPLSVDEAEWPSMLVALEQQLRARGAELLDGIRDEHISTWRRLCGIAKSKAIGELLADELDNTGGEKVVVFAHHREVVAQLRATLAGHGVVAITGEMSPAQRQDAVDAFQTDPAKRVAICQLVAGGVGITLTAAHQVVFAETSWTPGENRQAADRCHRIGQTHAVLVRTFALANSVDEVIQTVLARKIEMLQQVIGQ